MSSSNIKNLAKLLNDKGNALAGTRNQLDQIKNEVTYQRRTLVDLIRQAQRLEEIIRQAESSTYSEEDAEKVWQSLERLPAIDKVKIDADGKLKIRTNLLRFENPKKNYKAVHISGVFDIVIDPDGRVRFRNRTYRRTAFERGMHHPHVMHDGRPCLGSIASQLPELVRQRDYVSAVFLCLEYLRSANPEDPAGALAHLWPVCPDWANANKKNARKAIEITDEAARHARSGQEWLDQEVKKGWEVGMADARKKLED